MSSYLLLLLSIAWTALVGCGGGNISTPVQSLLWADSNLSVTDLQVKKIAQLCKQALEQRKVTPSIESQISKKNTSLDSTFCWFQICIFLNFSQLGKLANSTLPTICKVLVRNSLTEHPAFSFWWHLRFPGRCLCWHARYTSQQLPRDELLGWAQQCNFILYTHR